MPDKKISVIAGGGILYRYKDLNIDVVLIKRKGVWDLPKGKQEEGESIKECARREVAEEVGIAPPLVDHHIGQTWHTYVEDNQSILKTTYWYAMRPVEDNPVFTPQTAERIEEVVWFALDKAEVMAGYKNLKDILKQFRKLKEGQKGA